MKVNDVQKHLHEVDGWLIYDFQKSNSIAHHLLAIPSELHLTRRFFYWIPKQGEPIKIVHALEPYALDHLPGSKLIYLKRQALETHLQSVLKGLSKVAMEYSPMSAVPAISKVEGGVIDLVRHCGVKVVSSGNFLQYFSCVMDQKQIESHFFAAHVLDQTASKIWHWITEQLSKGITEFDVQQRILKEFDAHGCITDHPPNCSVNAHSAIPHYNPTKNDSSVIRQGDFILIDLWCKQNKPRAVFADITRVAVAGKPTEKQQEIFSIVRQAQKEATDFIQTHQNIRGCQVDEVCRNVIEKAGYGDFFTHRTGHNIFTEVHGPGAHLDSLETLDDRLLIPNTCYSIEPGIYLPGEFGIRLEYDIFLGEKPVVTGGIQDKLSSTEDASSHKRDS